MKKELCFYEIKSKCTIRQKLLKQIEERSDVEWAKEFEWKSLLIPDELLMEDPFLRKLKGRVDFLGHILGIMPYQFYDWHTDDPRSVSINLLLNDCHCHTLFSRRGAYICDFVELVYKPDTYYILNTNVDHSLINFDKPRFILSLSFRKEIDYIHLAKEVLEID